MALFGTFAEGGMIVIEETPATTSGAPFTPDMLAGAPTMVVKQSKPDGSGVDPYAPIGAQVAGVFDQGAYVFVLANSEALQPGFYSFNSRYLLTSGGVVKTPVQTLRIEASPA